MRVRLAVVGSINMDLSVAVPRLPAAGETVLGGDVVHTPGGKGANQAVAGRRLGADVRMIGVVGDDRFGGELRAALARDGVDVSAVRTVAGAATGVAMILVRPDGENVIAVAPGANQLLRSPAVGPASALLLQLEIPIGACLAAVTEARGRGTVVVLNAAPPPAVDDALRALLAGVDVLVVNEAEAAALHGGGGDRPRVASALRRLGPGSVVVTLGPGGAAGADADGAFHVPAFPVTAVDAVGAGDAFCAELAIAVAEGVPLRAAVRRACAAGALATTRRGAQASLPERAEVDALAATRA